MQRILIKGGSGAGKSTLGRSLAARLGLPYVELDALHHGPNWTAASAEQLRADVQGALDDARGWVVDGNYESKLGALLLDRAELIVWLDFPLRVKLARLVRRTAGRMWSREALWNGNRETLSGVLWEREGLFPWAVRSHFAQQTEWPTLLAGRNVVRLRTPGEADAWLAEFRAVTS